MAIAGCPILRSLIAKGGMQAVNRPQPQRRLFASSLVIPCNLLFFCRCLSSLILENTAWRARAKLPKSPEGHDEQITRPPADRRDPRQPRLSPDHPCHRSLPPHLHLRDLRCPLLLHGQRPAPRRPPP